ncbi:MAG: PD-(D/E)XK nuclease family protein [Candidatus Poribacteria bacterium]|nr:PD-(D/E)XK nuclease family protein [Candidatus Poribacteria bacterium]
MENIENTLKTRIENDKAHTFVVIVPTDSARLHRQRELVSYHPNRAVANLRVHTSVDFIQRLYNQAGSPKQHILSGIQHLWLHEIVDPDADNTDTYQYDAFRPIQNTAIPDSTLSLILDTINHLRDQGETEPNFVENDLTKVDLARIYSDHEAKLGNRWIDEKGKHYYLANNFKEEFIKRAFPGANLVVVEGFTLISKADIKLLRHIAEISDTKMWFRTDCVEDNKALYKSIIDLVSQFKDTDAYIDTDYERDPDQHQHFAENLFKTDVTLDQKIDLTDKIKVLEPTDRSEEVEQIAHLIQKQVLSADCKLSEICVVCYNIGNYQHRIAEVFPTYGIPYSFVESVPLMRSEVVKEIFSHISPRQVPLGNTYVSEVKSKLYIEAFHPDEFKNYIDNFLESTEVISKILNPMLLKDGKIVGGEVNALQQFKKIIKGFCDVLKSEEDRLYKFEDYINKLRYIAKHTHYQNGAPASQETVKIFPLSELTSLAYNNELRSLEFDTVFLGDFVEGRFPENYRPDPLLPETPYRNEEEQLHDNRLLFYRVLKSFRERLYILIPQREREAELIPSPFLGQLKAIADVETIKVDNPERGSIPGFLSTYGNHVWTTETLSDGKFPANLMNMRSLIKHVVKVEKSREKTHKHLVYEGVLTPETLSPESRAGLEERRQRTYSVTELETYAKCPFQYFAAEILELGSPDEEDTEGLSSREKGELVHDILVRFYDDRREQPAVSQCDETSFEAAKQQLSNIIDEMISDTDSEDLFRRVDKTHLKVMLNQWLTVERGYDVTTIPRYFEVSVGRRKGIIDSVLSRPKPICISNVSLNAKIDRIDIGNGVFNVIDYKTGRTFGAKDILEGRALQLPIYLEIARRLLGDGYETAAGLYHKVKLNDCKIELGIGKESCRGETYILARKTQQMLSDETFDSMIARVSGYLEQYISGMSNGNFPLITRVKTFVRTKKEVEEDRLIETEEYGFVETEADGNKPLTPRNKTAPCSYCAYKRICRVGAFAESSESEE